MAFNKLLWWRSCGFASTPARLLCSQNTGSSAEARWVAFVSPVVACEVKPRQAQCCIATKSLPHSDEQSPLLQKRFGRRKHRLDELCQERFPQYSRSIIQSWILQGKVLVNGERVGKAGARVSVNSEIKILAEIPKYVCRAGYKLEGALEYFACDVTGKVALDAGLSTGGFTDCLLQQGAAYVFGVDVGYGQSGCRKDQN